MPLLTQLFFTSALFVGCVSALTPSDSCDASFFVDETAPSPSSQLTAHQINLLLKEHNDARRSVRPYAKVMPMLAWNQKLADYAFEYMSTCPGMVHSSNAARSNLTRFGFSYVGENLAAGQTTNPATDAGVKKSVVLWNDEVTYWTFPLGCTDVCGHYTQNIWADTTAVGCGYAYCAGSTYEYYWSCVYGSGGNYKNTAPYTEATTFAEAATCTVPKAEDVTTTPLPPDWSELLANFTSNDTFPDGFTMPSLDDGETVFATSGSEEDATDVSTSSDDALTTTAVATDGATDSTDGGGGGGGMATASDNGPTTLAPATAERRYFLSSAPLGVHSVLSGTLGSLLTILFAACLF